MSMAYLLNCKIRGLRSGPSFDNIRFLYRVKKRRELRGQIPNKKRLVPQKIKMNKFSPFLIKITTRIIVRWKLHLRVLQCKNGMFCGRTNKTIVNMVNNFDIQDLFGENLISKCSIPHFIKQLYI